jgi:ABC-type Fe3+ transport system permease subunit
MTTIALRLDGRLSRRLRWTLVLREAGTLGVVLFGIVLALAL